MCLSESTCAAVGHNQKTGVDGDAILIGEGCADQTWHTAAVGTCGLSVLV
jgi:hypothetical protein